MGHDVRACPLRAIHPSMRAFGQHTSEPAALLIPSHNNPFTYLQLPRDHEADLGNIPPHPHSFALHLRLHNNEPRHRLRREP